MLAWLWLDVAVAAQAAGRGLAEPRRQGTLSAMHYGFDFELPKFDAWLAPVAARNTLTREMRDDWF